MKKRKLMTFLMAICLLLSMLPTTALAASKAMDFDLELSGKTQGLKANEEVTVDFYIRKNVGGLAALQWDLCYDSTVFKVKDGSGTSAAAPAGFTAWVPTFKTGCITGGADTASPTTEAIPDLKIYTVTFVALVDITTPTVIEIKDLSEGTYFGDMSAYVDAYSTLTGTTKKTITSAISNDLPVAIAKPEKGVTPETAISGTNYTGSIAWTPAVTGGKFAANTEYTANVKLTAKTGYQFASDVNPIVTNATSVTDKNVADAGKTLTFKAAFPATGNKTLKGIKIITNPALTLAVPTAAPNATATNERSLAVTGVYDDGSGGPVAATWKITTDPKPTGVTLVGSTLKVTNEAEAGKVRVEVAFDSFTDAEFVTITKDAPVESAIVLTAPTPATVAVPKSDTPNEIDLPTAIVYDQYGKPMTGTFSITYEIVDTAPTGVTLNTAGGKMKVKRFAQAGVVEIVGKLTTTAGTVTSDPVTYTITRETSKVTDVLVSKLYHNMPVPKVTEPGGTSSEDQQFTAEVLDQYLQEMTGQTVTWRVTDTAGNPVHGVSIDDTGKLTVTNEAPGIKVYAIATCQGVDSNNLDMTLHRDTAKDTFVKICNQVGDAPETSLLIPTGSIPKSEDYTAKVYDQYGKETAGMVNWTLDKTYIGVELDTTSIPGSATLKVDNTAAPGTIQLIANCSTLGSTASKTLDITLTNKTPASVTTAPTAKTDLEYNGTEQALLTAGVASGGTMQYSLGSSPWSSKIPTAKDAGTYSVQYKAAGDATHTDTTPVTLEVTIAPKTLTKADLTPTGSTSKVYDGTTNSSIPVGVKAGVLYGADTLSITGTAVYNSADVNEANTITFTPDAITGNYELVSGVLTITGAKITPRDLTVTPNAGQSKKFGAVDPTLHSTNSGRVPGQIPDFTGALSRAEGEDVGQYDITQGTLALMDHFSSGFKASNYTLKMVSPAEKFEITKADAPTLKDITDSQKYTVTTEQNKDIGTAGMPANAGTLTYAKGTAKTTGTVKVDSWSVDATTGKVTYTLSGGAAGDTVTLPVIIKSTNYADATVNVVITLTKPSSSGGGGSSHSSRYTITVDSVKHGTITVSPKSAYKGDTVTITVKPDKGYELDTLKVLDKDGDKVKITEKKGKYTFTMPASKVTIKGKFVEEAPEQIFADVPVDAYCYEAVKWAASEGITGGIGNNLFAPGLPCTRGQIVTFLWRAAGSPAPKSMSSFADVAEDAYYAKAVAWAVENGITGGTGDGKFSPDATCTRAQAVTFLYRASGSPAVSGSAAFSDVAADAYYASAVKWAEKNGITGGIGGGLFGSGNNCTRGQIVTFLYRSVK